MKRTVVSALVLVMFGLGSTALAAPKGPKGPPAKAEILHCGCAMTPAGLGMEYKLISVSSRAKAEPDEGDAQAAAPSNGTPDGAPAEDVLELDAPEPDGAPDGPGEPPPS